MGAVMAPGRELDALVAEKVMGWQWANEGVRGQYRLHPPDSTSPTGAYPVDVGPGEEWSPSTDIAAAWEVVEKLRAMNSTLELYSPGALVNDEMGIHAVEWQATFKSWEEPWGPHGPSVEAQTAPHAICLAALKAVGAL